MGTVGGKRVEKVEQIGRVALTYSRGAQLVKNLPAMQETLVQFLGLEDPLSGYRLPTPVF